MRRKGFLVAFVGPDGTGKTTVCRTLIADGLPGWQLRYEYMAHGLEAARDILPLGRWLLRLRSKSVSEAMNTPIGMATVLSLGRMYLSGLIFLASIAEEWLRQARVTVYVRGGYIVIADRHFVADYFHYEMGPSSRSLHILNRLHGRLLWRFYPRPDLTVLLDAPAALLSERKSDHQGPDLEAQLDGFRQLGSVLPEFRVVDSARTIDEVMIEVRQVIEALARQREHGEVDER